MSRFTNTIDLYNTDEGDLFLGDNEDLEDTKYHKYRGQVQKIFKHLKSKTGDWILHPSMAADLDFILGKSNTRENANRVLDRIRSVIAGNNLLREGEFQLDAYPVSDTTIAIILLIYPPDTTDAMFLTFTYDLKDNRIIPRNA